MKIKFPRRYIKVAISILLLISSIVVIIEAVVSARVVG